jgi:hypothetical protein
MNILEHLDRLDSLILNRTKAPATAALRNQLSVVREQIEALSANYESLKNAHKVLKHSTEYEIVELKKEVSKLASANKTQLPQKGKGPRRIITGTDANPKIRYLDRL